MGKTITTTTITTTTSNSKLPLLASLCILVIISTSTQTFARGASLNDNADGLGAENKQSPGAGRLKEDAAPKPDAESNALISDSDNVLDVDPDYFVNKLVEKYGDGDSDQISLSVADLDELIYTLKYVHPRPAFASERDEYDSSRSESLKSKTKREAHDMDLNTADDVDDLNCAKDDWTSDAECVEKRVSPVGIQFFRYSFR